MLPGHVPASAAAAHEVERDLARLLVALDDRLTDRGTALGRARAGWEGGHRREFESEDALLVARSRAVVAALRARTGQATATVEEVGRRNRALHEGHGGAWVL